MLKKVVAYSFSLYSAALFASLLRVLVKSYIAKDVGKEALGMYSYYMTLLLLGSAVLAFGLKRAVAKQVAAEKEEQHFAPLVAGVMALAAAASLVLGVLAVLLYGRIETVYLLALVSVGPMTLFELATATLRGQFDQRREVGALIIAVLVQAGCVVAASQLLHIEQAPVLGLTLAYGLLAVGVLFYFIRRFPYCWRPSNLAAEYRSAGFRLLLALSAPIWISDILAIVGHQADQLIVQGRLGYGALAEYAAAFTFIGLMDQPMTVLSRVFLVTFAGGHYHDPEPFYQASGLNLALFSLLGFGVTMVAYPLTPLIFSPEFSLTPVLVLILSISSIFNSVEVMNSSLAIARDYPRANRDARLWTTVLYIPLAFWLVSRWGVIGAAWSSVFSWACYGVLQAFFLRVRLPAQALASLRQMLLGTGLYMAALAVVWLSGSGWLILLVAPLYYGLGQLLKLWDVRLAVEIFRRLKPGSA